MAKFKFSLKSVEKYRNVLLDEAKGRYAKAVADSEKQVERIDNLKNELNIQNEELNLKNSQGISILELQGYKTYMKILESNIKDEEYKLKTLRKIEQKRRFEMIAANTDAMSIEKVKEKRWEEFLKEEEKKQQESTLEFVANQISRRE